MAKRRPQNQSQSSSAETTGNGGTAAPREPAAAPPPREVTPPRPAAPPAHREPAPVAHRDGHPAPVHAAPAHAHAGHGHGHVDGVTDDAEHHIVPIPTYIGVFIALMVLLVVTLLAAIPDLGALNLPIALSIAVAKTVLIMAYFMHLKFSSSLVRTFGTAAFLWLIILFVLTLNDYLSRNWLAGPQ